VLNVSGNASLEVLHCYKNQLSELDISKNPELKNLDCSRNQLANLEVSGNPFLYYLNCGNNQLTRLDLSNNAALTELYINGMPALFEVCVWKLPFPPPDLLVDTNNSPNIYYTTDCSK
jgi:hypothetical protein